MMAKATPPWANGPGELLKHGLRLLQKDSDTNRRIAMICIDNSIELMMKTFLGLPFRITGIKISRKDYADMVESFPKLLDAIETHASDKIVGIDLGEIEWFHRLRNELYHQGNGLTVDRKNVDVYAEIANLLFLNLFGFKLIEEQEDKTELLGKFMEAWIKFEQTSTSMSFILSEDEKRRMPMDALRLIYKSNFLTVSEFKRLELIRRIRNEVVHGVQDYESSIDQQIIDELKQITKQIETRVLEATK
ncbi:hypothetical protein RT717_03870 [Imperialibacter roseus]|uniref:Apea-like HEPN domain-containing protein n=1 Tax=Imperialibacter roseus TaxID=1324217 RepID=A0ABZ0IVQ2_9BACT|nr:hypothetical protein [Imperialibacter roseus]WOK07761.1 hypothetical protein RT717_03870 [Imperialibacter roseus]